MLYKSGQERYHEEIQAVKKVVLNLYRPATIETIALKASEEVNRKIEIHRVQAALKELCDKKEITKSPDGYIPVSDDYAR